MSHKRDFKKELARIVKFLNHNDRESQKLWYVLTALRGPDTNTHSDEIKDVTTAIIRQKIGLTTSDSGDYDADGACGIACIIHKDSEKLLNFRQTTNITIDGHFKTHVDQAFKTLDMKWDEVNPPYKQEPTHVK